MVAGPSNFMTVCSHVPFTVLTVRSHLVHLLPWANLVSQGRRATMQPTNDTLKVGELCSLTHLWWGSCAACHTNDGELNTVPSELPSCDVSVSLLHYCISVTLPD